MDKDGTIRLRDGRALAYAEWGDAAGTPVLHVHGIPGSRLERHVGNDAYARLGIRYVTVDRPGYGRSDPHPGRTFTSFAPDVEQLMDTLGIERFRIVAVSGGAPFALSIARALPSRIESIAIVSGVGPSDRPGALDGIDLTERINYWAAPRYPRATTAVTGAILRSAARLSQVFADIAARGVAGQGVAARAPAARIATEQLREALRQGARATVDENAMCARPWGFQPEDVATPVRLWHGDRDRVCPLHHAEHLASALPNATLTVLHGGHMIVLRCIEDVLRALVA
jgi:pimeloyl-ACP methyl ester carboxylesterase